jgi:uncharacterized sulfatase
VAGVAGDRRPATEGMSLLGLLRGEKAAPREAFFGSYDQYQYKPAAKLRMIRTNEWKLVRNVMEGGEEELYHLAGDPGEFANRVGDGAASAIRQDLTARLDAWRARLGDATLTKG